MLILLLACSSPVDDVRAYPDALAAVARDPRRAAALCAPVARADLEADCVLAGAEQLAGEDPAAAAALCEELPAGVARDECGFQVAEKSGDPARCAAAGRFADDCRLHLWSRDLRGLLKPGEGPGDVEARLEGALATYGLAADDPRPWSALYRELLARRSPLDRASCQGAPRPEQREACARTGRALYDDRLNMARDRRLVKCGSDALPTLLQTTPDPELDALRAARWGELCP